MVGLTTSDEGGVRPPSRLHSPKDRALVAKSQDASASALPMFGTLEALPRELQPGRSSLPAARRRFPRGDDLRPPRCRTCRWEASLCVPPRPWTRGRGERTALFLRFRSIQTCVGEASLFLAFPQRPFFSCRKTIARRPFILNGLFCLLSHARESCLTGVRGAWVCA
jgi:hypothetical protein